MARIIRVALSNFIGIGRNLQSIKDYAENRFLPHGLMMPQERDYIVQQLGALQAYLVPIHLSYSNRLVELLKGRLNQNVPSWATMNVEIECVMNQINVELEQRVFVFIPPDQAVYLNPPPEIRFSPEFDANFSSAHADVIDAYACLGLDRYTAAVFHSMRILEKGLKALADVFSVSFDFQNWQNVIEQIEAKVKDLKNLPKGQQKSEDQQFYSEAAKEFTYFKDAWRNHVMHGRAYYGEDEARRIFEHVRSFMNHLAKRLQE